MDGVISRLFEPLVPGSPLPFWAALAAAAGLLLALGLFLWRLRSRRRKAAPARQEPRTEEPAPLPELELANLQGLGTREEQQDAFGLSRLEHMARHGLLAVLCDGMGGMAEGGRIAAETVAELISQFPWEDDDLIPAWVQARSSQVYGAFRGHGGTTLVAARLQAGRLSFWSVGDSDLFLLRQGRLTALSRRQEYQSELVLRALEHADGVEEAFLDPQAGALLEYIGKEDVHCDHTRLPFSLQPEDTVLLCSDGVSDTLTLRQIREAMALPPQACCDRLEAEIQAAAKPHQDNYTAIVWKYHGKEEKQHA